MSEKELDLLHYLQASKARAERERDELLLCNEAMREPMRRLREAAGMPAEGEGAVVDCILARLKAAEWERDDARRLVHSLNDRHEAAERERDAMLSAARQVAIRFNQAPGVALQIAINRLRVLLGMDSRTPTELLFPREVGSAAEAAAHAARLEAERERDAARAALASELPAAVVPVGQLLDLKQELHNVRSLLRRTADALAVADVTSTQATCEDYAERKSILAELGAGGFLP